MFDQLEKLRTRSRNTAQDCADLLRWAEEKYQQAALLREQATNVFGINQALYEALNAGSFALAEVAKEHRRAYVRNTLRAHGLLNTPWEGE